MEVATIILIITAIIAAIVAYIGFLQYLINRKQNLVAEEKLKLDLFDKRFKVYQITKEFLELVVHVEFDLKELNKFEDNTEEAVFLFDENLSKYLDKIYFKSNNLRKIGKQHYALEQNSKMSEENEEDLVKKYDELNNWLIGQLEELPKVFSPYLKFKVWK